jgi:hypothetical protein
LAGSGKEARWAGGGELLVRRELLRLGVLEEVLEGVRERGGDVGGLDSGSVTKGFETGSSMMEDVGDGEVGEMW